MPHDILAIASHFAFDGAFREAVPTGNGHINDTYAVTCRVGETSLRYLLQRINHEVFRQPVDLMENVQRVTEHIRSKMAVSGCDDPERHVLAVVPARDGANCWRDTEGNTWRAYQFVEETVTHETVESPKQAEEAARAFGLFQQQLVDLPGPTLHETIPDFIHGPKRFATFRQALEADSCDRATQAGPEIAFLLSQEKAFRLFQDLIDANAIPLRITHNDTKINNVLFDAATDKGLCVVDLDTVMPGLAPWDFGDLARTTLSPAAEDEPDTSRVALRLPIFEALVRGYLGAVGEALTAIERDHLVFAARYMTLVTGVRFLTDYLMGDTYYRTNRPGQNLDRCRTQLRLAQLIEEHETVMREMVVRFSPEA